MVRPDDLSRPIEPEREKRLSDKTLKLAADYLRLMRQAIEMRERKLIFFKTWRRSRLMKAAAATHARATEAWEELYLRFRPIISAALERGGAFRKTGRPSDAVNRLVHALERQVEEHIANDCFAALLWQALEEVVRPNADAIEGLQLKLHARAVLDECPEGKAVATIELLCYLRGELMSGKPAEKVRLSDQELDRLDEACEIIEAYLRGIGICLDQLTSKVLTNDALLRGIPGKTVRTWVQ